jgi:hypothetical protein
LIEIDHEEKHKMREYRRRVRLKEGLPELL